MKLMRRTITVLTKHPEIVKVGGKHLVNGKVYDVQAIDGNVLYLKEAR